MNIISKIASQGLKASKLKNVFVIFTISLATCMMMTIGLYFSGDIQRKDNEISRRYQASFLNITEEEIELLSKNPIVDKVGMTKEVGKIAGKNHELSLVYMDETQMELNDFGKLKGKMPKEKNEIVILDDYINFIKREVNIGDSITLGSGSEVCEFIVSGTLPVKSDGRNFMVIVSDKYVNEIMENTTYSAYIKLKNTQDLTSDEIREKIKMIGETINCDIRDIVYSSYYFALKDMDVRSQQVIIVGVYMVIILACALVIYSIFYVSVISKLNEYGRLRTIGANRKQIKAIIRKEANKLALMSIPLGVILSGIISYFIMPDVFNIKRTFFFAVVVSAVIYIMVKIATARPGKMAAAVPPIMAMKLTGYNEMRISKTTSKMHRRLSPFNLACISVMRDKKKTLLTICSLGLCGVLLMASASYLESINPIEMAKASSYPYGELKIRFLNGMDSYSTNEMNKLQEKDYFNREFINKVKSIDGVEGIKIYEGAVADFDLKSDITEPSTIDILTEQDFESIKPYITKGDVTYEEFSEKNGIIVVDRDWETVYGFNLELGDIITVTNSAGIQEKYEILSIVDADYSNGGMDVFFVSTNKEQFFNGNAGNLIYQIEVKVNSQKMHSVENDIVNLVENIPELEITTLEESAASYRASLDNQVTPIYMLVLFIGIFGIVNMINTFFTNVITRKKELSIFQTIGLSNKQLRNMLIYEGLIYFIGISIMTLSLGSVSGIVLCRSFNAISAFGKVIYNFPEVQVSIYLAVILLVTILCSVVAIIYYQRETLVERMRALS